MTDSKKIDWGEECIILTRVSTEKQDFSPQEMALEAYAKSLGYKKIHTISTKESGFKAFNTKEGFKQVCEYIESNINCNTIIVTELSRLGRTRTILSQISDYLRDNRIQLYVKDLSLKFFDDYGEVPEANNMMFTIFATLAESEMRQKKERFARAKKKYFAEGYSIGGHELFGYTRVRDELREKNTYKINTVQAEEINIIFDWYLNGIDHDLSRSSIKNITIECISKGFSVYLHSKRNVNKTLKEGAYTGYKLSNNKRKNPDYWYYDNKNAPKYIDCAPLEIKYPRILLDDNIFTKVQDKLSTYSTHFERNISNNGFVDKSSTHITLLSKLLICPKCGHCFMGEYRLKNGYNSHNYRCSASKSITPCSNKQLHSMAMLDSSVWSFIKSNISNLVEKLTEFYTATDTDRIQDEIDNLTNKIVDYEAEKVTETNIYRANSKRASDKQKAVEDYSKRIDAINDKIENLEIIIKKHQSILYDIEQHSAENIESEIKTQIVDIQNSKELLRKYIRLLIKQVVPLYSNHKYTVLEITAIESLGYSFGNVLDSDGIPILKKNEADFNSFLIIDKRDNHRIKLRLVDNPNAKFENDSFIYNSIDYSLDYIFNYQCLSVLEEPFLSFKSINRKALEENLLHFSISEIEYNRLNVYDNDKPMARING